MENTSHYAFEDDGRLWTRFNGGQRRPSTVEEMEGFCLERKAVFRSHPELERAQTTAQPPPPSMAMAV